jgi:hypothetical protein
VGARRLEPGTGLLPVVGEKREASLRAGRVALLERARDRGVKLPASLAELRSVGHLGGEGMLEGPDALGIELSLVDELCAPQLLERLVQLEIGKVRDPAEERFGEFLPDDRRGLEQLLVELGQPVDARCQQSLHAPGHRDGVQRLPQAVAPPGALEAPRLHQLLHDLLDEEGIASRHVEDARGQTPQ